MQKIADAGLSNRLVFGSDMPVYSHWQRGGYVQLVKNRVATIERIFGEMADDVLFFNFAALFSAADDRMSGADESPSGSASSKKHERPKARLSKDNMVRAARLFDETFFPALKGDDRKVAVLTLERGFIPILKGAQRGVEAICSMCREANVELGDVPAAKPVDAIVSIASKRRDLSLSDAFETNASTGNGAAFGYDTRVCPRQCEMMKSAELIEK